MPYDIRNTGPYYLAKLSGQVTGEDLAALNRDWDLLETSLTMAPHRITIADEMSDFIISYSSIASIANFRSQCELQFKIKSALVANRPVEYGLARMWHSLNTNNNIIIRIFSSLQEAEAWILE